ncbi:MAG: hypothetical protein ACE149_06800 [Armatimonadota bacterium]
MLQAEYGWTHEYVLRHVTPAQLFVWSECIRRRRAMELASRLELNYTAQAAALGGRVGWRALRSLARSLRQAAGYIEKSGWQRLIEGMGLKKVE